MDEESNVDILGFREEEEEKEGKEQEGRGGQRNICVLACKRPNRPLCRGGSVAFSAGYELRQGRRGIQEIQE